jgi:transposase
MRTNLFSLNDEQWRRIESHLPTDVRGKDRVDDRRVISGILHVLKSGCRWCDCPPEYGQPTTIYNRSCVGRNAVCRSDCFRELAGRGQSTSTQMIDSTHIKVHARHQAEMGAEPSDWTLARRAQHEDPRNCRC